MIFSSGLDRAELRETFHASCAAACEDHFIVTEVSADAGVLGLDRR